MAGIVSILFVFCVLIVGHELAHFLVARLFGFQTPVFGLGLPFGPHLKIGKNWDTEFRIHPLPFGAYVSIPELDPEIESEEGPSSSLSKPFSNFPVWKRVVVVLAGVGFYIVFAWLTLFASLNFVGMPNLSVVVQELRNSIAAKAGIKPGDQIVAIDSKPVSNTADVVSYLHSHPNTSVTLHVQRQNEKIDLAMTPDANGKVGMSLVANSMSDSKKVSLLDSFGLASGQLIRLTTDILGSAGTLLNNMSQPQSLDKQHQVKVCTVITIIQIGADIIAQDWRQLPRFVAMLSINMAMLSLVPWPRFDGSHLLAILINAARGKPLSQMGILRWAFIGDITRLQNASVPFKGTAKALGVGVASPC